MGKRRHFTQKQKLDILESAKAVSLGHGGVKIDSFLEGGWVLMITLNETLLNTDFDLDIQDKT